VDLVVQRVEGEACRDPGEQPKGFLFSDRGEHVLKGFEDGMRLFEVKWRE